VLDCRPRRPPETSTAATSALPTSTTSPRVEVLTRPLAAEVPTSTTSTAYALLGNEAIAARDLGPPPRGARLPTSPRVEVLIRPSSVT
jgi:hypothetical protein